jgi:hypothetical protein
MSDVEKTEAIEGLLKQFFGLPMMEMPWFHLIRVIQVHGTSVHVATALANNEEAKKTGKTICGAVSWLIYDNAYRYLDLNEIVIYAADSSTLNHRPNMLESC